MFTETMLYTFAANPALIAGGLLTILFVSNPKFAKLESLRIKLRSAIISASAKIAGFITADLSIPTLGFLARAFFLHNPTALAITLAAGTLIALNDPRNALKNLVKFAKWYVSTAFKVGEELGKTAAATIIDDNLIVQTCNVVAEEIKIEAQPAVDSSLEYANYLKENAPRIAQEQYMQMNDQAKMALIHAYNRTATTVADAWEECKRRVNQYR